MKTFASFAAPAIVAVSLLAAASAHAQSESMNLAPTGPSAQGLTRAQVQAELFKARANGSLRAWNLNYSPVDVTTFVRTRDEVRAEAIAASRAHGAAGVVGEDSGAYALTEPAPARATTPVYAGTAQRGQ